MAPHGTVFILQLNVGHPRPPQHCIFGMLGIKRCMKGVGRLFQFHNYINDRPQLFYLPLKKLVGHKRYVMFALRAAGGK